MPAPSIDAAELWKYFAGARLPLSLVLTPRLIATEKPKGFSASDTAFVHRMVDLFFWLDTPEVRHALTDEEIVDLDAFLVQFRALPWRVVADHPHISELDDLRQLSPVRKAARRLDKRLKRRTSNDPVSLGYRIMKGWTVFEPRGVFFG